MVLFMYKYVPDVKGKVKGFLTGHSNSGTRMAYEGSDELSLADHEKMTV